MTQIIALWSCAPGCGKSTVAGILASQGYEIVPFAEPMKRMIVALLLRAGYSMGDAFQYVSVAKHEPLKLLPGEPTARRLLQTLGTEWGRDCIDSNFWVDLWANQAQQREKVAVDDMRFVNEVAVVRKLGGQIWEVQRPGFKPDTSHRSEGGLPGVEFDRVIVNDGTVDDLVGKVDVLMEAEP
jgi:hypothetical protein